MMLPANLIINVGTSTNVYIASKCYRKLKASKDGVQKSADSGEFSKNGPVAKNMPKSGGFKD